MAAEMTPIRVDHHRNIHEIDTTPTPSSTEEPAALTLMDLVEAVSEASETEEEVLATVTFMLQSGRVQLSPDQDELASSCG